MCAQTHACGRPTQMDMWVCECQWVFFETMREHDASQKPNTYKHNIHECYGLQYNDIISLVYSYMDFI